MDGRHLSPGTSQVRPAVITAQHAGQQQEAQPSLLASHALSLRVSQSLMAILSCGSQVSFAAASVAPVMCRQLHPPCEAKAWAPGTEVLRGTRGYSAGFPLKPSEGASSQQQR